MTSSEKQLIKNTPPEVKNEVVKSLQKIRNETLGTVLDVFCDTMCEHKICNRTKHGNEHYFENHPCAKNTCKLLQSFSQNIKERQSNNELIKWT